MLTAAKKRGGGFLPGESALTGQFGRKHLSAITSVSRLVTIYDRHSANRRETPCESQPAWQNMLKKRCLQTSLAARRKTWKNKTNINTDKSWRRAELVREFSTIRYPKHPGSQSTPFTDQFYIFFKKKEKSVR